MQSFFVHRDQSGATITEASTTMATTTQLKQQIQAGAYDAALTELYTAAQVPAQRARYLQTIEGFERHFGAGREVRLYSAPGRTEIGGNHTDHNNGVVMAAAVDLDILAVVAKTMTTACGSSRTASARSTTSTFRS